MPRSPQNTFTRYLQKLYSLINPGINTHVADLKVLSHEEVEWGAGVWAYRTDAAAAVSEKPEAQVRTLLGLFFEQEFREL